MTAQHLAQLPDFSAQCVGLARAAPLAWGHVLPLAARLAGPERAASAASELIGAKSAEEAATVAPMTSADWPARCWPGCNCKR